MAERKTKTPRTIKEILDAFRRSEFAPTIRQDLRGVCGNYGKESRVILLPECADIYRVS